MSFSADLEDGVALVFLWAYLCLRDHVDRVLAAACGPPKTVCLDIGPAEHSGVDLGLVIVSHYCMGALV